MSGTSFVYNDTDTYENEIREIYSYAELSDFHSNRNAFEESMEDFGLPLTWKHMVPDQKLRAILNLLSSLEVSSREMRIKSCRSLAYLIQGNFGECSTVEEQMTSSQENVFLLYEQGIFPSFIQQLILEADVDTMRKSWIAKSSFEISSPLRIILSVLCTIVETMYHAKISTDERVKALRQQFVTELQLAQGEDLFIIMLLNMLNVFCSEIQHAQYYPVKKITILIWKVSLMMLGDYENLEKLKSETRKLIGLNDIPDNPTEVFKNLKTCQVQSEEMDNMNKGSRNSWTRKKVLKQRAFDNTNLENSDSENVTFLDIIKNGQDPMEESYDIYKVRESLVDCPLDEESLIQDGSDIWISERESDGQRSDNLDETTQSEKAEKSLKNRNVAKSNSRSLPWVPKVRKADLILHFANLRKKYFGFSVEDDLVTTQGFPYSIIEGVEIMKRYMYTSLGEAQIEREEKIENFPNVFGECDPNFADAPAEKLYRALLPKFPQYLISLLKILFATSSYTKNKFEKGESIIITTELNLDLCMRKSVEELKMDTDTLRHREIIFKSISAFLLLLLKQYKVNHIYQFEYISQQLMFGNCLPLILKILTQDSFFKSTIPVFEFPACVIGEQPEPFRDTLEQMIESTDESYSWRNMFTQINLVRILNKLVKWKQPRIMMLVVFKSPSTLSEAFNVNQAMFQVYVLKLIKLQLRYLGRYWKKTSMHLISAIYQKVRHRLTDDWVFSNENDSKCSDYQAEEYTLQGQINRFHRRRYPELLNPTYNAFGRQSEIDCDAEDLENIQISKNFENNYEQWLENEVFNRQIDWDVLSGN